MPRHRGEEQQEPITQASKNINVCSAGAACKDTAAHTKYGTNAAASILIRQHHSMQCGLRGGPCRLTSRCSGADMETFGQKEGGAVTFD